MKNSIGSFVGYPIIFQLGPFCFKPCRQYKYLNFKYVTNVHFKYWQRNSKGLPPTGGEKIYWIIKHKQKWNITRGERFWFSWRQTACQTSYYFLNSKFTHLLYVWGTQIPISVNIINTECIMKLHCSKSNILLFDLLVDSPLGASRDTWGKWWERGSLTFTFDFCF